MKYTVYQHYYSCIKVEVEAKHKEEARDKGIELISDMPEEEYAKQLVNNAKFDDMEINPEEGVAV